MGAQVREGETKIVHEELCFQRQQLPRTLADDFREHEVAAYRYRL